MRGALSFLLNLRQGKRINTKMTAYSKLLP
jgi:hypothetical protein